MNNTPEINLTLDPFGQAEAAQIAEAAEGATEQQAESVEKLAEAHLSEDEKKAVAEFAEKIDITNTATVLQYGAATQQKIANFSDSALQNVRTKDFGETGDMVAELVGELKNFNSDLDKSDAGFFAKLFGRAKKSVDVLKAKYDKAEVSVNNIVAVLENHQVVLLKDVATLDKMYETNLTYFKEQGLVSVIATVSGVERFDANTHPHVHFICSDCDAVIDLDNMQVPNSLRSAAAECCGGRADICQLSFTGLCRNCLSNEKKG